VNSRNPRLISSDSRDVSSDASSGFLGNAHAATIVALAAISGPAIFGPVAAAGAGACEQAAAVRTILASSSTVARVCVATVFGSVDLMMGRA
jgi:hypothetical protein